MCLACVLCSVVQLKGNKRKMKVGNAEATVRGDNECKGKETMLWQVCGRMLGREARLPVIWLKIKLCL